MGSHDSISYANSSLSRKKTDVRTVPVSLIKIEKIFIQANQQREVLNGCRAGKIRSLRRRHDMKCALMLPIRLLRERRRCKSEGNRRRQKDSHHSFVSTSHGTCSVTNVSLDQLKEARRNTGKLNSFQGDSVSRPKRSMDQYNEEPLCGCGASDWNCNAVTVARRRKSKLWRASLPVILSLMNHLFLVVSCMTCGAANRPKMLLAKR